MRDLTLFDVSHLEALLSEVKVTVRDANQVGKVFKFMVSHFGEDPAKVPAVVRDSYEDVSTSYVNLATKAFNLQAEALTAIGKVEAIASGPMEHRVAAFELLPKLKPLVGMLHATEFDTADLLSAEQVTSRAEMYRQFAETGIVPDFTELPDVDDDMELDRDF